MWFVVEIPLIVILVVILALIGGAYQIIKNINSILFGILFATIYLGLFVLLMKIYHKAHDKVGGLFFGINLTSVCVFWFYGVIVFLSLASMDTQGLQKYMAFIGTSENREILRYLVFPVALVLCFYLIALFLAYIVDNKILRAIFCMLPILLTLLFYNKSINICTESYSRGKVAEFMKKDNLQKYIVKKDIKVYYPVHGFEGVKRVSCFPELIPFEYSRISFTRGETIFLKNDVKSNLWDTKRYIEASNGKEVGIINVDDVENFKSP